MSRKEMISTIPFADRLSAIFYIELESLLNWANKTRAGGIPLRITDTWRSYDIQVKAYETWKKTGKNLNGITVPNISHPDHGKHVKGKAADLEAKREDLVTLGEEWERRGNRWGGRWEHPEPWHFEI